MFFSTWVDGPRHVCEPFLKNNEKHDTSLLCKNVKVPVWALFALLIYCNILAFKKFVYDKDTANLGDDRLLNLPSLLHGETNVPISTDKYGNQMSLEERVRYLELKANAFMNFGTDPFFASKTKPSVCRKDTDLTEYGCKIGMEGVHERNQKKNCPGLFDHKICIDGLPEPGTKHELKQGENQDRDPPCLVYDFGIRAQPQFGATVARVFGCEVHAIDPSPVSTEWWKSDDVKQLRDLPNYHFHTYGAGGTDGVVTLKEYNWGQVSILRYPSHVLDCKKEGEANCDLNYHESKSFQLPVKTLPTVIKELGHVGRTIDILKVDVEGSEYAFLENLLDLTAGCPDFIKQISLEWHHYSWDARYGEGASPSINAIATLLHTCGLKNFWQQYVKSYLFCFFANIHACLKQLCLIC